MTTLGTCPRCSGLLVVGNGARSRTDDATEVCGPCGMDEVLRLLPGGPGYAGQEDWPVQWCEATKVNVAKFNAMPQDG
jgi:hypothetical protein